MEHENATPQGKPEPAECLVNGAVEQLCDHCLVDLTLAASIYLSKISGNYQTYLFQGNRGLLDTPIRPPSAEGIRRTSLRLVALLEECERREILKEKAARAAAAAREN